MSEPKPIYDTASNTGVADTAAPLTCQVCGEEMRFGAMHVCRGVCEWQDNVLWVDTDCGETLRGVPGGYKFCPYCGRTIKNVNEIEPFEWHAP